MRVKMNKDIPEQLKLDILSYSPNLKKRAEAIKNQAVFGTYYLRNPDSKYYDISYAELNLKLNKSIQKSKGVYPLDINQI